MKNKIKDLIICKSCGGSSSPADIMALAPNLFKK